MEATLVLFDHNRYKSELLPAVRAVIERDEARALAKLLRAVVASPFAMRWAGAPAWLLEEYLRALEAPEPNFAQVGLHATPHDLQLFMRWKCIPQLLGLYVPQVSEVVPVQELRGEQATYLFARSNWIHECLTFAEDATGAALEYPFGDWAVLLSTEELKRFHQEVERIEPPKSPRLAGDFRDLQALVRYAANSKVYGLMVMER